jgi:polyhydroxyalkanoate synthesis regulator phasin
MLVIFELAMFIGVVWALLCAWTYFQGRSTQEINGPAKAEFHDRLRRLSRWSYELLSGARGRKKQVLTMVGVVFVLMSIGWFHMLLLGWVVIGGLGVWTWWKAMAGQELPSAPPKPLPILHRAASAGMAREMEPVVTDEPRPRRLWGWSLVMLLLLGGLAAWSAMEFPEVRREMREHVPQVAQWWDGEDAGRIPQPVNRRKREGLAGSIDERVAELADRAIEGIDRKVDQIEQQVDAAVDEIVERGESIKDEARSAVEGASSVLMAAKPATKEASSKEDALPASEPMKLSAIGTTEKEASRALFRLIGERLTAEAIRAGRPVEMASWLPDLDWCRQHFAKEMRIRKVSSPTEGVTLFEAEAVLPTLDEKRIDQVYHEYINDQVAGRSLALLKVFAGSVLLLGGSSVFLRLGTGRQMVPPAVSSKRVGWRFWKRQR